jgi:hypothetical protein
MKPVHFLIRYASVELPSEIIDRYYPKHEQEENEDNYQIKDVLQRY